MSIYTIEVVINGKYHSLKTIEEVERLENYLRDYRLWLERAPCWDDEKSEIVFPECIPVSKLERNQEIIRLYDEGASGPKIAKHFGLTRCRIQQILRSGDTIIRGHGGTKKHRPCTEQELRLLYSQFGLRQLGMRFNVDKATVRRWLVDIGILDPLPSQIHNKE